MTAHQWTAHLCRRLHAAVIREVPAGIGAWDEAWRIVEAPSAALLRELERIERGRGSRERAKRLALAVLEAWRTAAARYTGQVRQAA